MHWIKHIFVPVHAFVVPFVEFLNHSDIVFERGEGAFERTFTDFEETHFCIYNDKQSNDASKSVVSTF